MAPYGGFNGKIEMAYNTSALLGSSSPVTVTQVQSFSIKLDDGTDLVHEIGQRSPIAAVEGPIEVTVSVERFFDATTFYGVPFSTLAGKANTSGQGANTYINLGYYPNGATGGQPKLVVTNAKPTSYEFSISQNGKATEKAEFKAMYFQIGTL
jgi:hypothetical protein